MRAHTLNVFSEGRSCSCSFVLISMPVSSWLSVTQPHCTSFSDSPSACSLLPVLLVCISEYSLPRTCPLVFQISVAPQECCLYYKPNHSTPQPFKCSLISIYFPTCVQLLCDIYLNQATLTANISLYEISKYICFVHSCVIRSLREGIALGGESIKHFE